jgi:hypothetical protein
MEIITDWDQLTTERMAKGGYQLSPELLAEMESERDLLGPDGIRSAVTGFDLSEVDY